MSTYAERLRENKSIETNASSVPAFPGKAVLFNGQDGSLGLLEQGQDIANVQPVESIKFVVDFAMTRLRFSRGEDESFSSSYRVGTEKTPYVLNVDRDRYVANTKRDMLNAMPPLQADEYLAHQTIYVGYLTTIDGKPLKTPELVWFVSRGVQSYNLNEALKAVGGLSSRTMISTKYSGKKEKNKNNGGKTAILAFEISEMTDAQIDGFIKWVEAPVSDKEGAPTATEVVSKFQTDMIKSAQEALEAQPETSEAHTASDGTTAPLKRNEAKEEVEDTSDASATKETAKAPAKEDENPNPFAGGGANTEIDISDDDLPF